MSGFLWDIFYLFSNRIETRRSLDDLARFSHFYDGGKNDSLLLLLTFNNVVASSSNFRKYQTFFKTLNKFTRTSLENSIFRNLTTRGPSEDF